MLLSTSSGRWFAGLSLTVLALAAPGCGDGLSGHKYVEDGGKDSVEFKSGKKANVTFMGQTIEADYAVDGDKVTLDAHGNTPKLVLTHTADDTITGMPMSDKPFKRQ